MFSFYLFHLKNLNNSVVNVSLPGIFLHLHSIWSINPQWNVVYLLMGHTADFAKRCLTSSGIVPKEHLSVMNLLVLEIWKSIEYWPCY